jgi:hypothetical protein
MATMRVTGRELHVRFTRWERLMVRRHELVVPLAGVRKVERIEHPLRRTRGGRFGLVVTGVLKVGTWGVGTGVRQLVSVRRAVPALLITLDRSVTGGRFDELLISTTDAAQVAETIMSRA